MVPDLPAAIRLGSLVAVGMLLVAGCSAFGADAPGPVVVGVDLDLTGGPTDRVFQQALELRVEQLNQQRQRAGQRAVQLRVLDNHGEPDTSVANLAELATDPQVSAIIAGACDECVIAAAEQVNTAGVPVISLAAATAVAEPVGERRFVFQIAPDAAGVADVMAAELAEGGIETVGLVSSEDRYGEDGAREFGLAATALGLNLAVREVAGDTSDAAEVASRIASWRPADVAPLDPTGPAEPGGVDAVVLWTPEASAYELAVALREAGWDGQLWLGPGAAGDLFSEADEVATALTDARLLFTDTFAMDDVLASVLDQTRRLEWFDSYLSRYGTYHAPASLAADALGMILAAVDHIGTDPGRVRDTLEAVRLAGLTGPVAFSPTSHSGLDTRSLSVLRFTEDRWHAAAT